MVTGQGLEAGMGQETKAQEMPKPPSSLGLF